jgi:polar amino acid transport system substrate-binding protein
MSRKLSFYALTVLAAMSTATHAETLKVGINPDAAPVTFYDAKSNTFGGMSADLIAAVGKDAGFTVEYFPFPIPELIPALNSSKIDIIAANMRVTPERKALADFSDSFHTGADALIVPKADIREYKSITDLKGVTVGFQKGSAQLNEVQKAGLLTDVKVFDTFADVMREVAGGGAGAAILGATQARYEQHLGKYPDVRIVTSYQPPGEPAGIAYGVRKSDGELLRRINASLAKLQADGTVKKIKAAYGL